MGSFSRHSNATSAPSKRNRAVVGGDFPPSTPRYMATYFSGACADALLSSPSCRPGPKLEAPWGRVEGQVEEEGLPAASARGRTQRLAFEDVRGVGALVLPEAHCHGTWRARRNVRGCNNRCRCSHGRRRIQSRAARAGSASPGPCPTCRWRNNDSVLLSTFFKVLPWDQGRGSSPARRHTHPVCRGGRSSPCHCAPCHIDRCAGDIGR